MVLTRRTFALGCACTALSAKDASARVSPNAITATLPIGYKPTARDELGMWDEVNQGEYGLLHSNLVIKDESLNNYVRTVAHRLIGDQARDLRICVVRSPDFNAGMTPTGVALINSGLLVRLENEAQFAGALGHEAGHYLRQHQIAAFRRNKRNSAVTGILTAALGITGVATGTDVTNSIVSLQNAYQLGRLAYAREQESEADAFGLKLVEQAGLEPTQCCQVWRNLSEEHRASAKARGRRKSRPDVRLIDHPMEEQRMLDLAASAAEIKKSGRAYEDGAARFQAAIARHRDTWLDDQVKLNDPGASLHLVKRLASEGWTGSLRYYEGEIYRLRDEEGDTERAGTAYAAAAQMPGAPALAHRAHGYALLKAGKGEEGKSHLRQYLSAEPTAADRAMIEYTLSQ